MHSQYNRDVDVKNILDRVKSEGLFDEFRKSCLEDVEQKEEYKRLKTSVQSYVSKFLVGKTCEAKKDRKKQLREELRHELTSQPFFERGLNRVVDELLEERKIENEFFPEVERLTCRYLGTKFPDGKDTLQQSKGDGTPVQEESNFTPKPEVIDVDEGAELSIQCHVTQLSPCAQYGGGGEENMDIDSDLEEEVVLEYSDGVTLEETADGTVVVTVSEDNTATREKEAANDRKENEDVHSTLVEHPQHEVDPEPVGAKDTVDNNTKLTEDVKLEIELASVGNEPSETSQSSYESAPDVHAASSSVEVPIPGKCEENSETVTKEEETKEENETVGLQNIQSESCAEKIGVVEENIKDRLEEETEGGILEVRSKELIHSDEAKPKPVDTKRKPDRLKKQVERVKSEDQEDGSTSEGGNSHTSTEEHFCGDSDSPGESRSGRRRSVRLKKANCLCCK